MARKNQSEIAGLDDAANIDSMWSPRSQLFFFLGAIAASWGMIALVLVVLG